MGQTPPAGYEGYAKDLSTVYESEYYILSSNSFCYFVYSWFAIICFLLYIFIESVFLSRVKKFGIRKINESFYNLISTTITMKW